MGSLRQPELAGGEAGAGVPGVQRPLVADRGRDRSEPQGGRGMTARLAESHLTRSGGKHCPLGTAGTGAVGTVRLSETDGPGVGAKFRQSSERSEEHTSE